MAIDGDNGRTSTVGGGNTGYNWSGYAEWLAKTKNSTKTCNLIVNYYANGYNGSAAENPPPSSVRSYTGQSVDVRLVVEVASGDTMSNPGYVFVGWATSNNTPTITYNPGDTISNSWAANYRGNSVTNLYAVWTNQNVITYNPDDNSIEKSAIYQVKQSGQSATLKGATFTRTGYTQTGWATTAGGPKVYNLGGTYSSNNPLSLYPVWQANTYTITYVANEGTGTMADQTVTYDSTFTPRACSFTREGYSFSSWNESQDGKGIRWKVQEYTVDRAENITLYAIWKGNEYTVYYDDNYSRYSDEITGDIVTFESEYAQPLKKAEVSLSPIQDLHGYDSPWPAGGGVNKFYCSNNATDTAHGVTCSFDASTQTFTVGGTNDSSSAYILLAIIPTAEIVRNTPISRGFIGAPSGIYVNFVWYDGSWHGVNNGDTIPDSVELRNIRLQVGVYGNATTIPLTAFKFQLQEGSTAPTSWSPYSNICPITGRTGLSVYRTGKNLYSRENSEYNVPYYNQDGTQTQYEDVAVWWFKAKPNTKYTCSLKEAPSSLTYFRWINCDADKGFISRPASVYGSNQFPITITTPADTGWVQAAVNEYNAAQVASNDWQIQIEEGQTATAYEAFGNTYSVDWTSEAGTVYGGTLDVVTGVLTADRAMVDLGTLNWGYSASAAQFRASLIYAKDTTSTEVPNMKCEIYKTVSYAGMANNDMCISRFWASVNGINVKDSRYTDAATFKTAMSGVQLCYELATPLTYQLTATQVEALVGENNVWSDGGPITIVYALDEVPQNMPPSTAIFGDIFYTRRNQLSRFGLTFKGWNTVPDGSGEAWLPSGVSMGTYKRTEDAVWNVSHNVTLYAQWDPNVYPFGTVFFNGRNAQDLGIIVEELPSYYYAERAFNHKQVNGKNGDVILDTGRYENVKKVYKVACYDPSRNFYESAVALSTFLHSAGSDYIRLEDSYEPSSYRMAIYEETNEIENLLGKAGRCEITFNCMPQRFLLSGDEEITIPSSGYSIYNPTAFDAKPMIRIQGTGTVTINGRSVQVTENDNDMLVDCENQNAKDLSGADMNYFIYCDEFPVLKPGFNTISYTETIDAVKITPRWWIL